MTRASRFARACARGAIGLGLAAGLPGAAGSDEDPRAALERWLADRELDPRVVAEIRRFPEGTEPAGGYAEAAARGLRARLIFDVSSALQREPPGDGEWIDVSFPGVGIATAVPRGFDAHVRREFEDSIARIEVLALLRTERVDPAAALRTYTAPEFRKKASSRIEHIANRVGLNCVKTRGVGGGLVDPMHSCSSIAELHVPGLSSQHSQTVANLDPENTQPVYFKESVKTFLVVPEGLLFHYINYSRTAGMGSVSKFVGKRKIRGSQEKAIRELHRALDTGGAE